MVSQFFVCRIRMFFAPLLCALAGNESVSAVDFVADDEFDALSRHRVLFAFVDPFLHILKRLCVRTVEDKETDLRLAVELFANVFKFVVSAHIPKIDTDLSLFEREFSRAVIDSDRRFEAVVELLFAEALHEAALPRHTVADAHEFDARHALLRHCAVIWRCPKVIEIICIVYVNMMQLRHVPLHPGCL